ncbi:MAG: hypothetical protein AMXMBFR84_11980 [Candidatus Hydrogenedentota bacterium]
MTTRILAYAGLLAALVAVGPAEAQRARTKEQPAYPVKVGTFPQEVRTMYTSANGLPSDDVKDIAVTHDGMVYAATASGLAVYHGGVWALLETTSGKNPVIGVAILGKGGDYLVAAAEDGKVLLFDKYGVAKGAVEHEGIKGLTAIESAGSDLLVCTPNGVLVFTIFSDGHGVLHETLAEGKSALTAASQAGKGIAIGSSDALLAKFESGNIEPVFPAEGSDRWAMANVRGTAFDKNGSLWAVSPQGVARYDGKWTLYEGEDGLPYNDLTCVAPAPDGSVWFGTMIGAIRYDGKDWYYRQGLRWLPNDEVRAIAVDNDGNAWIATAGGVSNIQFQPMTLWEKAQFYETEIDKYHRRTEYGYVLEVSVSAPGTKEGIRQGDSDNDGLWTAMYGAGECFAYGATKDPEAKRRAKQAFEALRFLQVAPEGSEHAPPLGYVARTVVPTTEPDPNLRESYTLEGQIRNQEGDKLWRAYEPRWPKSKDGKYYWKSDTSSDELDGHFFFYPLYYDLVAETDEEKARVTDVIRKLMDHMIEHNYCLVDHKGVTRWGDYSPETLNEQYVWFAERGLKSISILAYLNATYHVTGDQKYLEHAKILRDKHNYDQNALWPEYQRGIGSANHSDDEMFLMNYYNLIKYEPDPELKAWYVSSLANWWRLEEPEVNPFFNFAYAALAMDQKITTQWGTYDMSPWPSWLDDSLETLKRFPLDRFDWGHKNSHRTDIVLLSDHFADAFDDRMGRSKGYRVDGKVLPVDERHFNHWNHDPWSLNYGGSGRELATGAVYTLGYYMGLYHGFIEPDK